MNAFLLGIYMGLAIVGAAGFAFLLVALLYALAKAELFFTLVDEGTAKAIRKWGEFHRLVMVYRDHRFDQDWDVRHENDEGREVEKWDEATGGRTTKTVNLRRRPLKFFGGLRWVGIPLIHRVHRYNFRWASFTQGQKEGKITEEIVVREEPISHILVQDDIYYTLVGGAETKELVPVNVSVLLTIRIVNPYKALFRVEQWLETVLNVVKPAVRQFVSKKNYEDLVKKDESVERELDEFLTSTKIAEYLERTYGIRLKKAGFPNIEPAGERALTYVAASTRRYEAEREKEQIATLAGAEVDRLKRVYAAINDFGDAGLAVRMMESIDRAGEKQGNWIIPFGPQLQHLLSGLSGRK